MQQIITAPMISKLIPVVGVPNIIRVPKKINIIPTTTTRRTATAAPPVVFFGFEGV
jgi:hypothetical protein